MILNCWNPKIYAKHTFVKWLINLHNEKISCIAQDVKVRWFCAHSRYQFDYRPDKLGQSRRKPTATVWKSRNPMLADPRPGRMSSRIVILTKFSNAGPNLGSHPLNILVFLYVCDIDYCLEIERNPWASPIFHHHLNWQNWDYFFKWNSNVIKDL